MNSSQRRKWSKYNQNSKFCSNYESPLGARSLMRHSCNANCAGKRRPCTWLNSHAFCSHLVDVMLRPTGHASRLIGDIMPRWVSFRSVLHCKSGLVPNQELLRVRSGWHGINLKAYSSTVYFAYHTFGYYKIKQTTLVLNKGKSILNFPDARTRICHAVRWPSPTSSEIARSLSPHRFCNNKSRSRIENSPKLRTHHSSHRRRQFFVPVLLEVLC